MTEELRTLFHRLLCGLCNGQGTLHSRASTVTAGEVVHWETHRPCPVCLGTGLRAS